MRRCPFHNCGKVIAPDRFACYRHWYSLSRDDQAKVWACFRAWQAGRISGEELRASQQEVLGERGVA